MYNIYPSFADEKPIQLFEQKIKAGLVYNLLKYTTWSASKQNLDITNLQVCLFGDDPFDGYLSPLQGRTAQQAKIVIVHVLEVKETENCNIVIVHRSQEENISVLFEFLRDKQILTISDIPGFSKRGGMVELTKEGEKISMYINKSAVNHAGLDIQSRMLRLAKLVAG